MVKAELGAGLESSNLQSQKFLTNSLCCIFSDQQLKVLVLFLEYKD